MSVRALHDERRSFLIFLIFVVVTAFCLSFPSDIPVPIGVVGIIWGVLGFFRLVYLTQDQFEKFPKILSLPSGLLFGLGRKEEQKREAILSRLSRFDVVLWLIGGLLFIVWALFCSFYPAEIAIVQKLHLKQAIFIDFPIQNRADPYAIVSGLSHYGTLAIIMLLALSYSQSQTNGRWILVSLFPVFIVGTFLIALFFPPAETVLRPDINVLKGGGLGQSDLLGVLAPKMIGTSGTGLMERFTEMGAIGAYGVYVLFLPAFVMILRQLLNKRRRFIRPALALVSLLFLALLDVFWLSTALIQGVLIIGLTIFAVLWGATSRRHQRP